MYSFFVSPTHKRTYKYTHTQVSTVGCVNATIWLECM